MPRASDTVAVESLPRNRTSVAASIVGITDTPSGLTNAIRIRFCPSSTRSKRNLIANAHCGCVTGTSLALRRSNEPRMFNLLAASTVAASHNVKISTFMLVARVIARAHTQLGCIFVDRIAHVEWPGNIRETIRCPFSAVAAVCDSRSNNRKMQYDVNKRAK